MQQTRVHEWLANSMVGRYRTWQWETWWPLVELLSWYPIILTEPLQLTAYQGPVSLRLLTSQFKDIVTHMQKLKTVKCIFCVFGVWVQNFVWNFKGALWNFTQNFEPIYRKIWILQGVKNLMTYGILSLKKRGPRYPRWHQQVPDLQMKCNGLNAKVPVS